MDLTLSKYYFTDFHYVMEYGIEKVPDHYKIKPKGILCI